MQLIDRSARTAAADEDGVDHIGSDTPRSGIATPQPDLQDKRLPGITSYFGQVRQDPFSSYSSSALARPDGAVPLDPMQSRKSRDTLSTTRQARGSAESSWRRGETLHTDACIPSQPDGVFPHTEAVLQAQPASHPYPTPPSSHTPSSEGSMTQDSALPGAAAVASQSDREPPEPAGHPKPAATAQSQALALTSEVTTATRPVGRRATSPQMLRAKSLFKPLSPDLRAATATSKWYSLEGLKELTRGVMFKSGPPTPTRALSAAHSSHSEGKEIPGRTSNDGVEASGSRTPRSTVGAQAPAPKGKLTIKITEARGLRRSRDPYVVAVFQRSELISGGPRPIDDDEIPNALPSAFGGIPIQRQGSDSGRPMAIPMRSRQSSNTSITDYNTFRNRTARPPILNPKWDAEAVLFVTPPPPGQRNEPADSEQ